VKTFKKDVNRWEKPIRNEEVDLLTHKKRNTKPKKTDFSIPFFMNEIRVKMLARKFIRR